MSDALRWPRMTRGAGIALALFLGIAAQAEARGIVADLHPPNLTSTCDLTAPACAASDLTGSYDPDSSNIPFSKGVFDNVFIYNQGVISLGDPLIGASVSGGLASLAGNYIAPGLANYASTEKVLAQVFNDGTAPDELRIYWIFKAPDANDAVFGIDMKIDPTDSSLIDVNVGYGISGQWFSPDFLPHAIYSPCYSPDCPQSDPPGDTSYGGEYLAPGTEIGSSFLGFDQNCSGLTNSDLSKPLSQSCFFTIPLSALSPQSVTSTVPEPTTWTLMLFGLGAIGLMAVRQRRRRDAANPLLTLS